MNNIQKLERGNRPHIRDIRSPGKQQNLIDFLSHRRVASPRLEGSEMFNMTETSNSFYKKRESHQP
jgi:hypothetical protein